jgi:hypothetical protein
MREEMSKVFVVLGATGVQVSSNTILLKIDWILINMQGGSIVEALLADTSRKWKIRAVTRDPTKSAAKDYENKGVEIVKGDLGDFESLRQAFVVGRSSVDIIPGETLVFPAS